MPGEAARVGPSIPSYVLLQRAQGRRPGVLRRSLRGGRRQQVHERRLRLLCMRPDVCRLWAQTLWANIACRSATHAFVCIGAASDRPTAWPWVFLKRTPRAAMGTCRGATPMPNSASGDPHTACLLGTPATRPNAHRHWRARRCGEAYRATAEQVAAVEPEAAVERREAAVARSAAAQLAAAAKAKL